MGFLRREDEKLEAAQVRRIIVALDEKCHDVEFESRPGRAAAHPHHFYLWLCVETQHPGPAHEPGLWCGQPDEKVEIMPK